MRERLRRLAKLEAAIHVEEEEQEALIMLYEQSPNGPRLVDILSYDRLEARWKKRGQGEEFTSGSFTRAELREAMSNGGSFVPN